MREMSSLGACCDGFGYHEEPRSANWFLDPRQQSRSILRALLLYSDVCKCDCLGGKQQRSPPRTLQSSDDLANERTTGMEFCVPLYSDLALLYQKSDLPLTKTAACLNMLLYVRVGRSPRDEDRWFRSEGHVRTTCK